MLRHELRPTQANGRCVAARVGRCPWVTRCVVRWAQYQKSTGGGAKTDLWSVWTPHMTHPAKPVHLDLGSGRGLPSAF